MPAFAGCIQIDAHPFKYWYENHYGVTIGLKKGKKVAPTDEEVSKRNGTKPPTNRYETVAETKRRYI